MFNLTLSKQGTTQTETQRIEGLLQALSHFRKVLAYYRDIKQTLGIPGAYTLTLSNGPDLVTSEVI